MHPIIRPKQYLSCNDGRRNGLQLLLVILMNRRSQRRKEAWSLAFSADPGLLRRGIDRPKLCPSCVIIEVQSASATTLPGAWEA